MRHGFTAWRRRRDVVSFDKFEPHVILRPELDATLGEVQKAVQRLAEENLAQQFELNVVNNFVDKYAPIRVQH